MECINFFSLTKAVIFFGQIWHWWNFKAVFFYLMRDRESPVHVRCLSSLSFAESRKCARTNTQNKSVRIICQRAGRKFPTLRTKCPTCRLKYITPKETRGSEMPRKVGLRRQR